MELSEVKTSNRQTEREMHTTENITILHLQVVTNHSALVTWRVILFHINTLWLTQTSDKLGFNSLPKKPTILTIVRALSPVTAIVLATENNKLCYHWQHSVLPFKPIIHSLILHTRTFIAVVGPSLLTTSGAWQRSMQNAEFTMGG